MNKPILFNTKMVQAILDGRKTVTRRACKVNPYDSTEETGGAFAICEPNLQMYFVDEERFARWLIAKSKIKTGDILWVRETWAYIDFAGEYGNGYVFKASDNGQHWEENAYDWKWHPSIHMPREAARIFLRVTDVRAERLNDMAENDAKREGVTVETNNSGLMYRAHFSLLWDSTIKPSDLDRYEWSANPWVWVISFERTEKPEDFV